MSTPGVLTSNPLLDAALSYARRGWRVVPLHNLVDDRCTCQEWRDGKILGECRTPGKHPRFRKHAAIATTDEKTIRAWWKAYPEANIGISAGRASAIWALDKDPRNGGDVAYDALVYQHGLLPYTVTSQTGGGGTHELWAWPADIEVPFALQLADGLEVLGEGHIIVAPPSRHPSGRRYAWAPELGPEEMAPQQAPGWLLAMVRAAAQTPAAPASPARNTKYPPAEIGPILAGCSWMAHCAEDAGALGEPEWYAMLAVAGRCTNGENLAHELSRPYPGYSQTETTEKLRHALSGAGPTTCAKVQHSLGGGKWCDQCAHAGRMKSPIVLGQPAQQIIPIGEPPPETARRAQPPIISFPPEAKEGTETPDILGYPLTDSGNGERMVALYGQDVHYCFEMQKWMVWDHRRWAVDQEGAVKQLAKRMARLLYLQAVSIPSDSLRKATEQWARKSESAAGINATLARFQTEEGIPISAAALDQRPFLLNCLNGTLDLNPQQRSFSGPELRSHCRTDLATKLCGVDYTPDAKCPQFLRFLHRIMGNSPDAEISQATSEKVAFIQKAFGYALTGDVIEKAVFCLVGNKGDNGKSTLLDLFRLILPEYSGQLNIETLLVRPGGETNATLSDLADLRGTRFVTTSEPGEGRKIEVGRLKYLSSGGTPVKSMKKYENAIEFPATHKIFIEMNERPMLQANDQPVWNRIKCIPFDVSIPREEQDKGLKARLYSEEAAGILAWAVRGCMAWQADGLAEPPEMTKAAADWRAVSDPLREFIDDWCDLGPGSDCTVAEMTNAYVAWCQRYGEKYALNRVKFNENLRRRGVQQGHKEGKRSWIGIGLHVPMDVKLF